ncbi:MAG: hypothetical protein ACYTAF_08070 [Planctomycetota bacterium]|jgi:hypothetical protein
MDQKLHVHGGFRLSAHLAEKVREVVAEISKETFGRDLSHREEDCPVCSARAKQREREEAVLARIR